MGKADAGNDGGQRQVKTLSAAVWIQFAILLLALLAMALHGEGRLSRIEQRMDDSDKVRDLMQQEILHVEQILETRPSQ
jgi:hypothetical protein